MRLVAVGIGTASFVAVVAGFLGSGAGKFSLVGKGNGSALLVTGLELAVGSAGHSSRSPRFGTGMVAGDSSLVGSTGTGRQSDGDSSLVGSTGTGRQSAGDSSLVGSTGKSSDEADGSVGRSAADGSGSQLHCIMK